MTSLRSQVPPRLRVRRGLGIRIVGMNLSQRAVSVANLATYLTVVGTGIPHLVLVRIGLPVYLTGLGPLHVLCAEGRTIRVMSAQTRVSL